MASHNLDQQPEEKLVTEIAEVKRQLSELRTLQLQGSNAINMQPTGVIGSNTTATPTNSAALFKFTLTSSTKKMIFATFCFTIWEGSMIDANIIGEYNVHQFYYRTYHRTDWRSIDLPTNGYNQTEYVWVENQTGSPQDIYIRGEWRYLVNPGSTVITS